MIRGILVCMVAAALACGDKEEPTTTATNESAGESTGGTTTGAPASTGGGTSTGAPTTGGTTDETTGTTMAPPPCETDAMSCGVSVSDESSECPDPPPDGSGLTIDVLGPGSIKISQYGHDSECGLTIGSIVKLYPDNQIFVSYDVSGTPQPNCVCKYTISVTLSNLPAGTWTVTVLPDVGMVDVP